MAAANWTATITTITKDPTNGNVNVTVQFVSDDQPPRNASRVFFANDIHKRINALIVQYIQVLRQQDEAYDATVKLMGTKVTG